jgi:Xaa-Pro aminopeptidase
VERIKNLQKELSRHGLSALLISKPHNVQYLSNFVGTNRHLFITPKKAMLITDFRYFRSAKKQLMKGVGVYDRTKGLKVLMGKYKTIGFEDQFITVAGLRDLKKAVPGVQFKPIGDLLEKVRMIKEPSEIRIIKKGVQITEEALKRFVKTIKVGQSEHEMEWKLLSIVRKLGADGFSFPPIIAFGKDTADVHHLKEHRRLKKGEKILIDFGVKYKGYLTDMTRVFYLKQGKWLEHKIYSTVLEANRAGIKSIKVGRKFSEIDRVARKVIEDAGYGKYFGHSTGHGVGLIIHELPHVGEKSCDIVAPGMVFTIEPGIYIDAVGGVRIEDMVYVNNKGEVEVLTRFPKNFTVI